MKDNLFQTKKNNGVFCFNEEVAGVFDDMVVRSVPYYQEIQLATTELVAQLAPPQSTVWDLGCSTGTLMASIARRVEGVKVVGVDNSMDMIEKSKEKLHSLGLLGKCVLLNDDITQIKSFKDASVVIMLWTLQFIRPTEREKLLYSICSSLSEGGVLILAEKVLGSGPFREPYIELYHTYKKRRGYSDLEIARKRESLENYLIPYTVEENVEQLQRCGFAHVDVFFKWYNWAAFVAVK